LLAATSPRGSVAGKTTFTLNFFCSHPPFFFSRFVKYLFSLSRTRRINTPSPGLAERPPTTFSHFLISSCASDFRRPTARPAARQPAISITPISRPANRKPVCSIPSLCRLTFQIVSRLSLQTYPTAGRRYSTRLRSSKASNPLLLASSNSRDVSWVYFPSLSFLYSNSL